MKRWIFARLGGVRYRICLSPLRSCWGKADPPTAPRPVLRLAPDEDDKRFLDTVLHEALHATDWRTEEGVVTRDARDISALLWRLGYRRRPELSEL